MFCFWTLHGSAAPYPVRPARPRPYLDFEKQKAAAAAAARRHQRPYLVMQFFPKNPTLHVYSNLHGYQRDESILSHKRNFDLTRLLDTQALNNAIYVPWTQIKTFFFRGVIKEKSELLVGPLIFPPIIILILSSHQTSSVCVYVSFCFQLD